MASDCWHSANITIEKADNGFIVRCGGATTVFVSLKAMLKDLELYYKEKENVGN